MAKIIAIMNQKGGVGKTTTVVNISSCVAAFGRRTLALDIDPQANTTSGLGVAVREGDAIYDVITGRTRLPGIIKETKVKGLSVAPSDIRLAAAEVELIGVERREHILKNHLKQIDSMFDYVFIDCPPSLGQLTLNALTAANSVLVPIQCEYFALEGVGQLMKTIQMVKRSLNPSLEIEGIALTMLDGRTNLGMQVVGQVKKHFKGKVYASVIPRTVRLSEAPSHGLPINLYDPKGVGASAYNELAKEFLERIEAYA